MGIEQKLGNLGVVTLTLEQAVPEPSLQRGDRAVNVVHAAPDRPAG